MKRSLLVRRLLRARRVPALAVLLVAFGLTAALTGLVTVRASAARAVADTTQADHAGFRYAVQVLDASVLPALATRNDLLPIWEDQGSAATATRQVPVTVRAVASDAAAPGALVRGERPRRAGEATMSQAVLRAIGADIGDIVEVTVAGRPVRAEVTGVTISPADRHDATAVLLTSQDPRDATLWVTNTDVFADPRLRPMLERRQAKARTVGILADEREDAAVDTLLTALRYSVPAFAVLAICLTGIMLAALHRERQPDVSALAAAGMPTNRGWRLLAVAAAWCLVAGAGAGAVTTIAGCYALREQVSALLGQQWRTIAVPWPVLVAYLPLYAPAALLMARLTSRGQRASAVLSLLRAPAWTGAALLAAGAGVLVSMTLRLLKPTLAPVAGAAAVAGATLLLAPALTASRRRALSRLIGHAARPLVGVALAAAIVTFSASYYTARQEHSAQVAVDENVPYQPLGSLFVDGISADARHALQRQYHALGGRSSVAYLAVAEPRQMVRATSPDMVECLKRRGSRNPDDVLDECGPTRTLSPINAIALTDEPRTAGLRADKAFVRGGEIGLLTFPVGEVLLASAAETEPAQPDPVLGGNLPGAVIGVDSPVAKRLNLIPSGGQSLVLVDFAALSEDAQARMRSLVSRVASTALIGEARDDTEARFRAIATAVTIGATSVIVLMLTTVGMAFLAAHRDLRRMFGQLGIGRRQRRAVAVRMLALPIGAQVVALAAGRFCAWLAGVHNESGFGWLWTVPGLSGVAVCVVLAVAYGRVPRSDAAAAD